ncbi:MAG: HD domain-containing protein [Candidatus Omnitrophica bacterium]|nr:HD domain-containing protein [Candidatus Omnitrophota bacterium]
MKYILIVEDDPDHAELASSVIKVTMPDCKPHVVHSRDDCMEAIKGTDFDVILLDYYLGDAEGIKILEEIKEINRDVPVIIVTGLGSERIAVKMIKMGAYDYLVKSEDYLEALPVTIKRALNAHEDVVLRREAEEKARESDEQYRNLVDNINIGIYRSAGDNYGTIIQANQALSRILGYTPNEITSKIRLFDLFDDAVVRKEFLGLLIVRSSIIGYECRLARKDGKKVWVSVTAKVQFDGANNIKWIDGTVEDITERKKAEIELAESVSRLRVIFKDIVSALAATSDLRDPFTAGHQKRVAQLAVAIAAEMGYKGEKLEEIEMSALVHDIGKINIPIEILSNPRRLTTLEYEMIKTHAQAGHDILKTIEPPWIIAQIIHQHHERLNGSGYPKSLLKEKILLSAQILSVADVVEAMSSHRPYRPARGLSKALEEISQNKGKLYGDDAVEACLRIFTRGFVFRD